VDKEGGDVDRVGGAAEKDGREVQGVEFVCRAPDDGLEVQESRRKLFEDGGGRECLSQWSPTQPNEIYQ